MYEATTVQNQPTCILAKTFKGHGIPGITDQLDWHGKPIGAKTEAALAAIQAKIEEPLQGNKLHPRLPTEVVTEIPFGGAHLSESPAYKPTDKVISSYVCSTLS